MGRGMKRVRKRGKKEAERGRQSEKLMIWAIGSETLTHTQWQRLRRCWDTEGPTCVFALFLKRYELLSTCPHLCLELYLLSQGLKLQEPFRLISDQADQSQVLQIFFLMSHLSTWVHHISVIIVRGFLLRNLPPSRTWGQRSRLCLCGSVYVNLASHSLISFGSYN